MMLTNPTELTPALQAKLATATDDFIRFQLPDWLKRASQGQIKKLRDSFKTHKASQDKLRSATSDLLGLQSFAEEKFQALLSDSLPDDTHVADLRWVTVSPHFSSRLDRLDFTYGPKYTFTPGLLKLMQGFSEGASFYVGSGLALEGSDDVLVAANPAFIERCRTLDVGKLYQDKLDQVYGAENLNLLAEDKRSGFILAIEIAALRGQINALEQLALREVAEHVPNTYGQPVPHSVNTLELLGHRLSNALLVELREFDGVIQGVLLYLPSDPIQALRRFTSFSDMREKLVAELRQPGFRQCLGQQVSLKDRHTFLQTLDARLKDAQPDLQVMCGTIVGDAFLDLSRVQVRQIKDDARLLLVPTEQVNDDAAKKRIENWSAVGSGLTTLAGLFNPVVGALLLGQLVAQTLSEVFEGVVDWSKGHQHEALEHLLSAAEVLAYTGATVAGVKVVRSAFVDSLEPIALDAERKRLWASDLKRYETTPDDTSLRPDGLYGAGTRRWMRRQNRYYEVHRPVAQGSWRLRHPLRDNAYGPLVLHNGQRSWRLLHDRPLEWNDSARMLNCLWPQDPPLDAARASQILHVAGIDQDELRGVLVENRPAPIALTDTLRRFEVDARIEAFIRHLNSGELLRSEEDLLDWCSAQPDVAGPPAGLRERLIQKMPEMRWRLFESFAFAPRSGISLANVVSRDFPGLPKGYIPEVLQGIGTTELEIARQQPRLPLVLATKARSLLRVARLTRAVEGFYLGSASCEETDQLALALLRQLPERPADLSLEVRDATPVGRLLATLGPEGSTAGRICLVRVGRHFQLFNGLKQPLQITGPAPATIFDALVAGMSSAQLQTLGIDGDEASLKLRQRLSALLPGSHDQCAKLLGWQTETRWFNPGQRLADGRVGYLLSGRGDGARVPGPRQHLLDGLRQLFPGLDDNQLNQELERLLRGDDMPFASLAALQDDHEQLNRALNGWVSAELNDTRQANRQRFAELVLRAWRGQGERLPDTDGQPGGLRLVLGFGEMSSLPPLPGHVQFNHVTALAINDSSLTTVASDFLHGFVNVRNLNLNGNRLLGIPTGIGYMPELRTLRMARNRIRMNRAAVEVLAGLPRVSHLDLSYNPLGVLNLPFARLQQLVQLNVRHCRLSVWPANIELCPHLQMADVRDNQLTMVAPETLQMPQSFRQAFLVDRNPLSNVQVFSLYSLDAIPEESSPELPLEDIRSVWIGAADESSRFDRSLIWEAVAAVDNSGPFLQLLGRLQEVADFARARRYLAEQVWALLQALQEDAVLRSVVFGLVDRLPAAQNRIADTFSQLQLRMLEARFERVALRGEQRAALMAFGLGRYRLDYIDEVARRATAQVNQARALAREAGEGAEVLDDVDGRDINLLYRIRLRESLRLPGQPQTMFGASRLGVSEASIVEGRLQIERQEGIDALADDLSQRSFWQYYLRVRYADDFLVLETAHRNRIARYHADNPQATSVQRAQALDDFQIEHDAALHRHRVVLTRQELRTDSARQG